MIFCCTEVEKKTQATKRNGYINYENKRQGRDRKLNNQRRKTTEVEKKTHATRNKEIQKRRNDKT